MTKQNAQKLDAETKLKIFCEERVPEEIRNKIKMTYETNGNKITIFEEREPWTGKGPWTKMPIAQIRYNEEKDNWTIYWRDRNEKWHLYTDLNPRKQIEEIIKEIDSDPNGIFWG
jgi:hypothetical protein